MLLAVLALVLGLALLIRIFIVAFGSPVY